MLIPSIMFVDDDDDDTFIIQDIIRTSSISASCIFLRNGEEVLSHLKNGNEIPDAIFMDLHMPKMDGFSCLSNLKRNEHFRNIPVIIYSTSSDPGEAACCISRGAASFISKPSSVSAIEKIILTIMKNLPDNLTETLKTLRCQFNPYFLGKNKHTEQEA